MLITPNLEPALRFLAELRQNNNKPWFEQHRGDYTAARAAFEQLVDDLIDPFRESDRLEDLRAKDCVARIYRDIRFTKDKSPYKTNLGAIIARGGWNASANGYYIALEPGGQSLVAGGLYDPTPEQLNRFRQAVITNPTAFKQATGAPDFVEIFGEVQGERLKTAPKGYDKAHAEIALLQLKQVFAMRHYTDEQVLAPDFVENVLSACRAMRPFLDYLAELSKE